MEQESILAVATWGDPSRWSYAEYISGEKRVRAFSTLSILREVERPAKILVVVLDTLADYETVEAGNYGKILEHVERYVGQYLCGVEAEVAVLPGVYERRESDGKRLLFESSPRSEFLPLLTYTVLEKALEADATSIVLDVSHGMNFMPTLALRACEEAAAALATARVGRVRLRVYQSDPYPAGVRAPSRSSEDICKPGQDGEPPILNYNLILERAFEPWDLARYISYESQQALKVLTDVRGCELGDARNLLEGQTLPLLGAFRLGALLQLALLAKVASMDELKRILEGAVNCWKSKRGVREGGPGTLEVSSGTRFAAGFWVLVHVRAVLEGARKLLELIKEPTQLGEVAVTLDELGRLKKLVEGSKVISALVNREISKLKYLEGQWLKLRSGSGWLRCDELQLKCGSDEGRVDESIFKRDFIAHAGFHTDALEIRLAEKELEIRVRSDQWERVNRVLREVTQ